MASPIYNRCLKYEDKEKIPKEFETKKKITVYQAATQFMYYNMQIISSPNAVILEFHFSDGISQTGVILAKEIPLSHLLSCNCQGPLQVHSLAYENFTERGLDFFLSWSQCRIPTKLKTIDSYPLLLLSL